MTKPDGTLAGFEIGFATDHCARMKVKYTITADSALDGMIPALNAGKYYALIADVATTPRREELIALLKTVCFDLLHICDPCFQGCVMGNGAGVGVSM